MSLFKVLGGWEIMEVIKLEDLPKLISNLLTDIISYLGLQGCNLVENMD
jgi:hypothetical protein